MNSILIRFRSLPRAARWLAVFLVFMGAYFVVIEPVLDLTARLHARADRVESQLRAQAHARQEEARTDGDLALGAARFGDALFPGDAQRQEELSARLEDILSESEITSLNIKTRVGATLRREALAGVIPAQSRVGRIIFDVDFESSPETAGRIIAELERSPEVASIGTVSISRIDKDGGAPGAGENLPRGVGSCHEGGSVVAIERVRSFLGRSGQIAIVLLIVAIVVIVLSVVPLVRAVTIGSIAGSIEIDDASKRLARFESGFDEQRAQYDGRSMFFVPPEPPPPAKVAQAPRERPIDARPKTPTRYSGPRIIAMVNGSVWFEDGTKLRVGGDEDGDLRVLSAQAPWSARVQWRGAEFDVPLFERTTSKFLSETEAGTGS